MCAEGAGDGGKSEAQILLLRILAIALQGRGDRYVVSLLWKMCSHAWRKCVMGSGRKCVIKHVFGKSTWRAFWKLNLGGKEVRVGWIPVKRPLQKVRK
jgi:hypothetical protein